MGSFRTSDGFRAAKLRQAISAWGRSATFTVVSLIEADFDTRRSPRRRGRAAFVTHLATNELGGDLSQSGPRGRELTAGDRTLGQCPATSDASLFPIVGP